MEMSILPFDGATSERTRPAGPPPAENGDPSSDAKCFARRIDVCGKPSGSVALHRVQYISLAQSRSKSTGAIKMPTAPWGLRCDPRDPPASESST